MSVDPFDIVTDVPRNMVRVTMRGHWSLGTIADYRAAVGAAVTALRAKGCKGRDIAALVDARELTAQSQDAIADYRQSMIREEFLPRKLATVLSSALFKRQVERIDIPNQRIFTDPGEALSWLLATDKDD